VLAAAALGFGQKLDMGGSPATVVIARQTVPDLTRLPASLQPLVEHMLQPQPDNRPSSIREVLEEARTLADTRQSPNPASAAASNRAAPGPAAGRAERSAVGAAPERTDRNRNRFAGRLPKMAIFAGCALVLAVALVIAFVRLEPEQPPGPAAEQIRGDLAAAKSDFRCAALTYSVDPDRTVTVSGYVSAEQDLAKLRQSVGGIPGIAKLNFEVRSRFALPCEAGVLLKPLLAEGRNAPKIALSTPASDRYAGQELAVEVETPNFDSYVYVDYFTPSGDVVHLFPNEHNRIAVRPTLNRFSLGRPPLQGCWTFADGTGEQLISVIASERRLFARPESQREDGREYLDRLAQKISSDAGRIAAAALSFEVNHDHPRSGAAGGCAR
jgi:hypothetical protein